MRGKVSMEDTVRNMDKPRKEKNMKLGKLRERKLVLQR